MHHLNQHSIARRNPSPFLTIAFLLTAAGFAAPALAQTPLGTSFTYQGELKTNSALSSGLHDLRFRLYDATIAGNQIGSTLCANDISVSNGKFTISLDFGAQFAGQQRFLEIDVRADTGLNCANSAGFTTLGSRQPLSATPNAVFATNATNATTAQTATTATSATTATTATTAANATNATQLNGQPASFYSNAGNLSTGTLGDARLGGTYSGALNLSNAANTFVGNGAGLTNLSASSLAAGTLADARLSTNVAIRNTANVFTGQNTFTQPSTFNSNISVNTSLLTGLSVLSMGGAGSFGLNVLSGDPSAQTTAASIQNDSTSGISLRSFATATSGQTVGADVISISPQGTALLAEAGATTGAPRGVWSRVSSATGYSGFFEGGRNYFQGNVGIGTATPAFALDVVTNGSAIAGQFTANYNNDLGAGVFGTCTGGSARVLGGHFVAGNSPNGEGVLAEALAGSGTPKAVRGLVASPTGYAAYFEGGRNYFQGNIGINNTNPTVPLSFSTELGDKISMWPNGAVSYGFGIQSTALQIHTDIATSSTFMGFGSSATAATFTESFRFKNTSGQPGGLPQLRIGRINTPPLGQTTEQAGSGYILNFDNNFHHDGVLTAFAGGALRIDGRNVFNAELFQFLARDAGSVVERAVARIDTAGNATFAGAVIATGIIANSASAGVKAFKIDHPLDPENKYLMHSCVESPDMKNIYDGLAVTDARGFAIVTLPSYFSALNMDFRYQLTIIDDSDNDFILAKIYRPIDHNEFIIKTSQPNTQVSWQVTGTRKDNLANQLRIIPETDKEPQNKGKFLHPAAFDLPPERGIFPTMVVAPMEPPVAADSH